MNDAILASLRIYDSLKDSFRSIRYYGKKELLNYMPYIMSLLSFVEKWTIPVLKIVMNMKIKNMYPTYFLLCNLNTKHSRELLWVNKITLLANI